jgi:HlyD family secretion protein
VDYENPSQGDPNSMYYGTSADEMTAASRYPFYVELDSTEGLILGQHVYLELETQESDFTGPVIDMAFVCYEEDGSAYLWAESRGKLEKRAVTLGESDPMTGTVQILTGLTLEDYIAFPDEELCKSGTPTTHEYAAEQTQAAASPEVAQ